MGSGCSNGDDRHLIINGKRLDASTPHFENVYSFNPKEPPRDSHYSGHVNEKVQKKYYPNSYGNLAPLFSRGTRQHSRSHPTITWSWGITL